ncbi:MAG: lipocalin family protein [Gemmatimonadota bacterium]|nr:lipocalin family protein [Gemmatimonadota bacterium]MDH5196525.1 lipocalin family protein [Gemmatimonadota bacterium]
MLRSFVRPLALLGIVGAVACSDSLAPTDIAGTWNATSFVFTSVADPTESVDVLDFGVTLSMTFEAGGAVTLRITEGGSTETETGTYTIDGSTFSITTSGDTSTGTISKSGNTLTLRIDTGVEYDFDDDGTDDPARAVVTLTAAT